MTCQLSKQLDNLSSTTPHPSVPPNRSVLKVVQHHFWRTSNYFSIKQQLRMAMRFISTPLHSETCQNSKKRYKHVNLLTWFLKRSLILPRDICFSHAYCDRIGPWLTLQCFLMSFAHESSTQLALPLSRKQHRLWTFCVIHSSFFDSIRFVWYYQPAQQKNQA